MIKKRESNDNKLSSFGLLEEIMCRSHEINLAQILKSRILNDVYPELNIKIPQKSLHQTFDQNIDHVFFQLVKICVRIFIAH